MAIAGLIVTFLGFLLAVGSLGMTSSVGGRMGMVLVGIVLTLIGIIGLVNKAFMAKAVWRK